MQIRQRRDLSPGAWPEGMQREILPLFDPIFMRSERLRLKKTLQPLVGYADLFEENIFSSLFQYMEKYKLVNNELEFDDANNDQPARLDSFFILIHLEKYKLLMFGFTQVGKILRHALDQLEKSSRDYIKLCHHEFFEKYNQGTKANNSNVGKKIAQARKIQATVVGIKVGLALWLVPQKVATLCDCCGGNLCDDDLHAYRELGVSKSEQLVSALCAPWRGISLFGDKYRAQTAIIEREKPKHQMMI